MSLGHITAILLLLVAAFISSTTRDRENEAINSASIESKATSFLIYIDLASAYKYANPSASGDITKQLTTPKWLNVSTPVHVLAQNNLIYVYTENTPRLPAEIKKGSYNSHFIGVSTQSEIVTPIKKYPKPNQIPKNSLVYLIN